MDLLAFVIGLRRGSTIIKVYNYNTNEVICVINVESSNERYSQIFNYSSNSTIKIIPMFWICFNAI